MIKSFFAFIVSLMLPLVVWAQDKPVEPEPQVSLVWVGVFFLICVVGVVWWVVATARASKKEAEAKK